MAKVYSVDVQLTDNSQPIKYTNVLSVAQKGDLVCLYLDGDIVHKYPINSVFRLVEEYGYHGRGRK